MRERSPSELEKRIGDAKATVWQEGDELTVACRTGAPQTFVAGGFEMTLWETPGTDVRTVTVRVRNLDQAILGLQLFECDVPGSVNDIRPIRHTRWIGRDAPSLPRRAESDAVAHDVPSARLADSRQVRVSLPEGKPEFVVYAADDVVDAVRR
jgi:hypothetical protein